MLARLISSCQDYKQHKYIFFLLFCIIGLFLASSHITAGRSVKYNLSDSLHPPIALLTFLGFPRRLFIWSPHQITVVVCGLHAAAAPGPPLPSCPPREFFTFTTCRGTPVSGGGGGGGGRDPNHYSFPLCAFIPSQQHQSNLSGLECRLKSSSDETTCVGPQEKNAPWVGGGADVADAGPLPSSIRSSCHCLSVSCSL